MFSINNVIFDMDYHIKHEYDGNKTLYFTISPEDERYHLISEEVIILCDGLYYIVKAIQEQSDEASVECPLCLDSLKDKVFISYQKKEASLEQVFKEVLEGTGWRAIDADLVAPYKTLDVSDMTTLQILEKCRSIYNVVYDYDNRERTITVIKPENILPKDVYITDQLNLRRVDYKGDSYDFITRLYPFGKTIKDKDGNETVITITSVNNGVNYVENRDYCNKVVSAVWRDESYTDAQKLKEDAIEKLKILSQPVVSYELDVADLAKINPKYQSLSFRIYEIVTLIDRRRNTKVNHRVVEMVEYPYHPEDNQITLSTVPQKIEGILSTVINKIDSDSHINKTKYNEIRRDLDTTISRVGEKTVYDQIESAVKQTKEAITMDFINNKISSSVKFSNKGLEIYNGSLQIFSDSIGLDNKRLFCYDSKNKNLCIVGILKSIVYPELSMAIGDPEYVNGEHNYGAFTFTVDKDGYGEIFSAYPVVVTKTNEKGTVWTAPFLNNVKNEKGAVQNRKGICMFPNQISLFADCNGSAKGVTVYSDSGDVNVKGNKVLISGDEVRIRGNFYVNNASVTSDRTKKTNIAKINKTALSRIRYLQFYSYDLDTSAGASCEKQPIELATAKTKFKESEDKAKKHVDIGIMADEAPSEILGENQKSIDLYKYINLLAKAVQELAETVDKQQTEIEKLKQGVGI